MVADKAPAEAMIHQPGVAIRALQAEAAGTAERERRIAAAVEEEERLFAALHRIPYRFRKPRRDIAAAPRAFALEIDRFDMRHALSAEAFGQMQPLVAPAS